MEIRCVDDVMKAIAQRTEPVEEFSTALTAYIKGEDNDYDPQNMVQRASEIIEHPSAVPELKRVVLSCMLLIGAENAQKMWMRSRH